MPAIVQTMPRIQFERDYIIFQNSIIFSICHNGGGLSEGILQDQKHKIFGFMDLCVCFFSWHVDANLPTSLYIGIFLMKFHLFLYLYMFMCVCAYKSVSVWYFCVWNHLVCIIYNATRKMFFWFISLFTDGKRFFFATALVCSTLTFRSLLYVEFEWFRDGWVVCNFGLQTGVRLLSREMANFPEIPTNVLYFYFLFCMNFIMTNGGITCGCEWVCVKWPEAKVRPLFMNLHGRTEWHNNQIIGPVEQRHIF